MTTLVAHMRRTREKRPHPAARRRNSLGAASVCSRSSIHTARVLGYGWPPNRSGVPQRRATRSVPPRIQHPEGHRTVSTSFEGFPFRNRPSTSGGASRVGGGTLPNTCQHPTIQAPSRQTEKYYARESTITLRRPRASRGPRGRTRYDGAVGLPARRSTASSMARTIAAPVRVRRRSSRGWPP